jgi:hypothetical protein
MNINSILEINLSKTLNVLKVEYNNTLNEYVNETIDKINFDQTLLSDNGTYIYANFYCVYNEKILMYNFNDIEKYNDEKMYLIETSPFIMYECINDIQVNDINIDPNNFVTVDYEVLTNTKFVNYLLSDIMDINEIILINIAEKQKNNYDIVEFINVYVRDMYKSKKAKINKRNIIEERFFMTNLIFLSVKIYERLYDYDQTKYQGLIRDYLLECVKNMSNELKDDFNIGRHLIQHFNECFQYLSCKFKRDIDNIAIAVQSNETNVIHLDDDLLSDVLINCTLVNCNIKTIKYIKKSILFNEVFLRVISLKQLFNRIDLYCYIIKFPFRSDQDTENRYVISPILKYFPPNHIKALSIYYIGIIKSNYENYKYIALNKKQNSNNIEALFICNQYCINEIQHCYLMKKDISLTGLDYGKKFDFRNSEPKDEYFWSISMQIISIFSDFILYIPKQNITREFIISILDKYSGLYLEHFPEYNDDIEVVLTAITNEGLSLKYASTELKNSINVVKIALNQNSSAIKYVPDELRKRI